MAEMKPVIPGIEDYNEARLWLAESRAQVAALTAERDALQAELAAAKQDTARLDFWMREVNAMYTCPRFDGAMGTNPSDEQPIDREYLDAAMLAARAPEGTR